MAWIRACGGGSPAVPDGRTVTPINDVTIWQQCAGIANPTYTTLEEILADTGILQTLMASDNAVDYMVRSKGFSGSKSIAVPTMTSNTTPSGEAFASSEYNASSAAWKAFDKLDTDNWSTADNQKTNATIGYKFTADVVVNSFTMTTYYDSNSTVDYTVDVVGIKSDNTEETIASGIAMHNPADKTVITKTFANTKQYRGYCLKFPNGNSAMHANLRELQFAFVGVCDNSNAMYYIGQNNYCANTLLADSDWCSAICNSTYFESALNVKVPTMTSDTTPSGECFASTVHSVSEKAYCAFDGNDSTTWESANNSVTNEYIGYQFTSEVCVNHISIKSGSNAQKQPKNYKLQGSNDGITYTDILDTNGNATLNGFDGSTTSTVATHTFNNSTKYLYYRLYIGTNWGGANIDITTMQFYGREDV